MPQATPRSRPPSSPKAGSSSFNVKQSESSKRRKTAQLRSDHSADQLTYAAQMKLRQEGKMVQSKLMREMNFTSPTRASKMQQKITYVAPTPFTPQEALALLINTDMSRKSYEYMYYAHKEHNSRLLPRYEIVSAAKKQCYPSCIEITDMSMTVGLQSLCDHTAKELLSINTENIDKLIATMDCNEQQRQSIPLTVLYKYGSDGSGSHARYSLPLHGDVNANFDETHIFATFICPIKVFHDSYVIWHNPSPSSPIFCRPVKLEFAKENEDTVVKEFQRMANEIQKMNPTVSGNFNITHEFIPTMIDGKVSQTLSGTRSSSTCYLCSPPTKPSLMNSLSDIAKKSPSYEMLRYGISPLHLYLNSLDLVLHLAYKKEAKVWRSKDIHKAGVKDRKV